MPASISSVVTRGYGTWGSVNLLPTWGYGIGVAGATLIGRWANVITVRADTGPIVVEANTGPITARAQTRVEI